MRTFKCYSCEHTWQLPHGEGGRGKGLSCPECGSKNVHREDRPRGRGWSQSRRLSASTTERKE